MTQEKIKIAVASDHAGFILKQAIYEFLTNFSEFDSESFKLTEVLNYGTFSQEKPVDYPNFAQKISKDLLLEKINRGILVCGTGIGVSVSANRFKGIRAALCQSPFESRLSREHNNSNILCLGAWIVPIKLAQEIITVWLNTSFKKQRHERRLNLIDKL